MTRIVIIAAVAQNGTIGLEGSIPWSIKADMRHFKRLTLGSPCIMGDVTYRSLPDPYRPLPGRENIVLTLDAGYRPRGTTVFGDFDAAVQYVKRVGAEQAFIAGGATIYDLAMPVADALELTRVQRDYEGDTFFPAIDEQRWQLEASKQRQGLDRLSGQHVELSFLSYVRRQS